MVEMSRDKDFSQTSRGSTHSLTLPPLITHVAVLVTVSKSDGRARQVNS
jgi:hypothetical protein